MLNLPAVKSVSEYAYFLDAVFETPSTLDQLTHIRPLHYWLGRTNHTHSARQILDPTFGAVVRGMLLLRQGSSTTQEQALSLNMPAPSRS